MLVCMWAEFTSEVLQGTEIFVGQNKFRQLEEKPKEIKQFLSASEPTEITSTFIGLPPADGSYIGRRKLV
jgi:hypothetical protein